MECKTHSDLSVEWSGSQSLPLVFAGSSTGFLLSLNHPVIRGINHAKLQRLIPRIPFNDVKSSSGITGFPSRESCRFFRSKSGDASQLFADSGDSSPSTSINRNSCFPSQSLWLTYDEKTKHFLGPRASFLATSHSLLRRAIRQRFSSATWLPVKYRDPMICNRSGGAFFGRLVVGQKHDNIVLASKQSFVGRKERFARAVVLGRRFDAKVQIRQVHSPGWIDS